MISSCCHWTKIYIYIYILVPKSQPFWLMQGLVTHFARYESMMVSNIDRQLSQDCVMLDIDIQHDFCYSICARSLSTIVMSACNDDYVLLACYGFVPKVILQTRYTIDTLPLLKVCVLLCPSIKRPFSNQQRGNPAICLKTRGN